MTTRSRAEGQRPAETTVATGDQWVIGHGDQRAVITETGATLRSFTVGDRSVIDGFGLEEWSQGGRGQVLAPWPNRLGDGRYSFEGVDAQAPINEVPANNAIHGLVRWLPWRMAGCAQNQVTMAVELRPSPAYPFALRLSIEYRLGRDGLTVVADADNIGESNLPFGIGFHPYLTLGTTSIDSVRLRIPASERLVSDGRGLPVDRVPVASTDFDFTRRRPIGVTVLDTAFTGLQRDTNGRARIELDHPDGVCGTTLWCDERFGYVMVYSGDTLERSRQRKGLAVEPMSCPPDAFRSGTDVAVLHPGGRWTGSWGITPR